MSRTPKPDAQPQPGVRQPEHDDEQGRHFAEAIADTVRESLLVLTPDLRVEAANTSFYQTFQTTPEQTEGYLVYHLGHSRWDTPEVRLLLEDVLPEHKTVENYEVTHDVESDGTRTLRLNACQLDGLQRIFLAIDDITEQRHTEAALRSAHEDLEARVEARTREVRRLAVELGRAEAREQSRIAQLLHDDLQQTLHAVQLHLAGLAKRPDPVGFEEVNKMVRGAIQVTRNVARDLSPPVLSEPDLASVLRWLAERMREQHHLEVEVEAASVVVPQEEVRRLVFTVVRELLFNVVKHAGVEHATLTLEQRDGCLVASVKDGGRGFDASQLGTGVPDPTSGLGLASIRERLRLFGGRLEIVSSPEEGAHVTVTLPVLESTLDA